MDVCKNEFEFSRSSFSTCQWQTGIGVEHFYFGKKHIRKQLRKAYKERRKARRKDAFKQAVAVSEQGKDEISSALSSTKVFTRMTDSTCQTKVVIDCAYDSLMSFKDICKLANQITNCYAFNRRASVPVQLYVTGLNSSCPLDSNESTDTTSPRVRLFERLKLCDCEHWDVNLCQEDYTELFPAESIVYLCAESSEILPQTLPPEATPNSLFSLKDVFIIGGLVDHNHLLGHCYKQAVERGHRTVRLPIKESGLILDGRYVLSTLQVFSILAPVLAGTMNWVESLTAALPPRKIKSIAKPKELTGE
ncbi:unnamed protein product [Calicophoron daubneyi]|uniref:tRNA (guanine(9)-N(1))-methyltransferase n=1 Tax=Calicophoron daubneyi TaxID=300641 RepID=A0AAV2TFJ5_CALDB